ncbi:hypothetical protein [Streptomyces sp. NPDC054808]
MEVAAPAADVPAEVIPSSKPAPAPLTLDTHRATAYQTLARLGRVEPRLALSDADCHALTDLVVPWLERGADPVSLMKALTAGLPDAVHVPRGFVARRLRDKLPPMPTPQLTPDAPEPRLLGRLMPECTECGVPGRPAAFVGGLCQGCRTAAPGHGTQGAVRQAPAPAATLAREAVRAARDHRNPANYRRDTALQP